MASVDVVTGTDILASEYNLLRSEVIANVSAAWDASTAASLAWDATVAASAAGADVVTHAAVTAQIHGLAANIDVLGAQTAGLHIQYMQATATWTHTGGQLERHSAGADWPVAFASVYAVADAVVLRSASGVTVYATQDWGTEYSVTSATKELMIYNSQGETASMEVNFIGVGN